MMQKRMHSREFKLEVVRQIASGQKRPAQACAGIWPGRECALALAQRVSGARRSRVRVAVGRIHDAGATDS